MHKASPYWFRIGAAALIAVASLGSAVADTIWKWRDKDGRVQVSDRPPPPEVPDKDILLRPHAGRLLLPAAPASDAASVAASGVDPALEAQRKKAQASQAEQAAADKSRQAADKARRDQARLETCQRARNQMAALESGQRAVRMNDKGEREVLDDQGRAAEMARTRQVIDASCGN